MTLKPKLNQTMLRVYVVAILLGGSLQAQNIAGNWQGTITPPQGPPRRMVLRIMPEESGALKAKIYSTASAFAAIISGEHKYTEIRVPSLAFFAVPHDLSRVFSDDPARHAAIAAADLERQTRLANAFEIGVPSATVIRLPYADHYIFRTNEAEVLRSINDFLGKLPQP